MKNLIVKMDNAFNLCRDYVFDKNQKIKTFDQVECFDFSTSSENIVNARKYQPSRVSSLLSIFNWLENNLDLKTFDFVDLGHGKGKVLYLASKYDFNRVIGIEFCEDLYNQSLNNLRAKDPKIQLYCSDILEWKIDSSKKIFYMFNPFNTVVMKKFLNRLEESLCDYAILVYLNPIRHYVLDNRKNWSQTDEIKHINSNYCVKFYEFDKRR